jgi:hypothetical protein
MKISQEEQSKAQGECGAPTVQNALPPRSGLVQRVIYRPAFADINIAKGRLQGEVRFFGSRCASFVLVSSATTSIHRQRRGERDGLFCWFLLVIVGSVDLHETRNQVHWEP